MHTLAELSMLEQMALMRERSAEPIQPEVKLKQHIDHCHESHAPVTLTKEKIQVRAYLGMCTSASTMCVHVSLVQEISNVCLCP